MNLSTLVNMYSDDVYLDALVLTSWNNLQSSSAPIPNNKHTQTLEIIGKKISKCSEWFYVLCGSISGQGYFKGDCHTCDVH